jgi:hypothetical protein
MNLQKETTAPSVTRQRCFMTLDAYVKLASLMIKCSGGQNIQTKVDLLKKGSVCTKLTCHKRLF